jgi:hypothetical protein
MGRPSIYGRAMTSAERQARYLGRQARKLAVSKQPQPVKPLAVPNPAETMVRVQALKLDPLRVMTWIHQRLGDAAFLRICTACDELRTAITRR